MKHSWFPLVIVLSACVSSPAPNFYNGRYYMAGDDNCVMMRALSPDRIMCINSKKQESGYRDALTDQQLYMYQQTVMQQQAANQQVYANLAAQSAARSAARHQALVNLALQPQAPLLTPPGGNQVRCISTGVYTNCQY